MTRDLKKKKDRQVYLSITGIQIYLELDRLAALTALVESSLRQESISAKENIKREIAKVEHEMAGIDSKEEAELLDGWYPYDLDDLDYQFPRIHRYSMLMTTMSVFEGNVKFLCRRIRQIFDIPNEFNEASFAVIKRGIKYFEEKLSINTNQYQHQKKFIKSTTYIRNCLVHGEGYLDRCHYSEEIRGFINQPIQAFDEEVQLLEIDNKERIVIKEGFIEIVIHEWKSLLKGLFKLVNDKI